MCDVWQSQIHNSPSDSVTTDVLAAMNRVILDIVGLAGQTPFDLSLPRPVITCLLDCWIRAPDSETSSLGFGYNFDALKSREDDLSSAFDAIMKTDSSLAQSTVIPLIGSIAPWIISIVSSFAPPSGSSVFLTDTL